MLKRPDDGVLMFMDGFDDCIAGLVHRFGAEAVVCYDRDKVIAKIVGQGSTEEEAMEWYDYNMIGSWVGESTPCFLEPVTDRAEIESRL